MPRVLLSNGDIFESGCAALVNPVDALTGAQGKGLAAAFKRRWPTRCRLYRVACLEGRMRAGEIMLDEGDPIILFAATKDHWRNPSQLEWVRMCLRGIVAWTEEEGVSSVAVPALGCGEGGLPWKDVRPLLEEAAGLMRCELVKIYEPK